MFLCIKTVHKYGNAAEESHAGMVLGHLFSLSEGWFWAHIKVVVFICCEYKCLCCHRAWHVSEEGGSGGTVRSRGWRIMVPAKKPPSGVRQEPGSHSHKFFYHPCIASTLQSLNAQLLHGS